MSKEHWKSEPDEHDFPAASDFLSLLFPEPAVTAMVAGLRTTPLVHRKAKDLLRAARLATLSADDGHVAKDLAKVHAGLALSPVLLVRGRPDVDAPLIIADGYHRICASYHIDDDADIPCRLVDPVTPTGPLGDPGRSAP